LALHPLGEQLSAGGDAVPFVELLHVDVDGVLAEPELGGDLLLAVPPSSERSVCSMRRERDSALSYGV
jgi:hypothetical protein